jgi:uncharacterized protein (DUF1501 family)
MGKKVLLDENIPQRLRLHLDNHEVVTTGFKGWAGLSNGALLDAAERAGIDVLVTADQGLNYQQNLRGRRIALVVISTNRSSAVLANARRIQDAIDAAVPGKFMLVNIAF